MLTDAPASTSNGVLPELLDRMIAARQITAGDARSFLRQHPAGEALAEGWFRVTSLARPEDWAAWPESEYRARKQEWFGAVQASARRFLPSVPDAELAAATVATDMFTPRTITRYTGCALV